MAERPLLVFPQSAIQARSKRRGGGGSVHVPDHAAQRARIGPRFAALQSAFDGERADLSAHPTGSPPEQVLVLETVGPEQVFLRAVRGVPGLEWLAEVEEDEIEPTEEFYRDEDHRDKPLRGRLFLSMANQRAMDELLSLWRRYERDPTAKLGRGREEWRRIFANLYSLRRWDVEDRLRETGLLEDWQDRLLRSQENVPVEIELWFRSDSGERARADAAVRALLAEARGRVRTQSVIPDIGYHAILAELPAAAAQTILQSRATRLIQSQQVMFFRPSGQCVAGVPSPEDAVVPGMERAGKLPTGQPRLALLDGAPLAAHTLLDGRLIIDDPDGFSSDYQASEFRHGTAMASLIVHGELDSLEEALSAPIYIRPILKPDPLSPQVPREERIPETTLPADLVYRAIRRILEGEAGEAAIAPTVKVINLSIGDTSRSFAHFLSPLARLVDWAASRYGVLICVSAGNHGTSIEIEMEPAAFRALSPADKEQEVLRALARDNRNRRILSPGESINALTIGAAHADASGPFRIPSMRVDPIASNPMVSPVTAQGLGFRRSIKPEILAMGGRQLYLEPGGAGPHCRLQPLAAYSQPGQRVAAPSRIAGDLSGTTLTRGTSNATALASRTAVRAIAVLEELRREGTPSRVPDEMIGVLAKALLVHASAWGSAFETVARALRTTTSSPIREVVARHLGYGFLDAGRALECTAERVTLLGFGKLADGEAHLYRLPLPPSLSGKREWRRLTATLAWFSPLNVREKGYRRAQLFLSLPSTSGLSIGRTEVDGRAVARGTVQHEVLEGERAAVFAKDDHMELIVNCRADAGVLEGAVAYGLAVSLEVAEGVSVPIYEEVRSRIAVAVRAEARA